MSPSDQLSSSFDSSLSHLQLQQATLASLFQPESVYKQASWTQIFQYCLCSCLENISSSTSLHLITACWLLLMDVPWPDEKTLYLRFLACLPSDCKSLCASPLALFLMLLVCLPRDRRSYFANPPCSCYCHNFITLLWCSFLLVLAWTAIRTTVLTRDWTLLWHSFGSSLWRKSLLLQACSCHLVPRY